MNTLDCNTSQKAIVGLAELYVSELLHSLSICKAAVNACGMYLHVTSPGWGTGCRMHSGSSRLCAPAVCNKLEADQIDRCIRTS